MNTSLMNWLRPPDQSPLLIRLRQQYIQVISLFLILAALIGAFATLLNGSIPGAIVTGSLILLGAILYQLAQRGYITTAALILVGVLVLTSLAYYLPFFLMATLAVISAAALTNGTIYGFTNALIFGKGIAEALRLWGSFDGPAPALFTPTLMALIALAIVTVATRYFIEQAEKAAGASREDASLIRAVAETGQAIAQERDPQRLLPRAADLIRDRLAVSHVQIYLVEADRMRLTRVATTDETLATSGADYILREQPAFSQVVMRGEPIFIHESADPAYSKLLALDSKSGLLVPVIDQDLVVIGVLDLQSRRPDAFPGDAPRTLSIMANLLGTAMQNARAFEEQSRNQQEIRRLFLEAETNLRENQRLNEQLSREGWSQYLANRPDKVGVTMAGNQLRPDATWTPALVKASRNRQVVTEQRGGQQVIAVPVTLGGEVIGAIEVENTGDPQSTEALETVKAVAQRLASSVDKARLFEETRATAAQEQRLNEIAARYQSVSSVDDLLRITLTELSDTLGATHGAIRLGKPNLTPESGEAT
jgi:GAF domain-containing protein